MIGYGLSLYPIMDLELILVEWNPQTDKERIKDIF